MAITGYGIEMLYSHIDIQQEVIATMKLNAFQEIAPNQARFLEPVRQTLINSTAVEDALVTPTQLGERLGLSAIAVNKKLVDLGLQVKNPRSSKKDSTYLLTERGKEFGKVTTALGKGRDNTTYQQLRWFESVADFLV